MADLGWEDESVRVCERRAWKQEEQIRATGKTHAHDHEILGCGNEKREKTR